MVLDSLEILQILAKINQSSIKADISFRNNQITKRQAIKDMEKHFREIQKIISNYFTAR